jgi:hypothetical protein
MPSRYEKIKLAYMGGHITRQEAIDKLMGEFNYLKEDAAKTVNLWDELTDSKFAVTVLLQPRTRLHQQRLRDLRTACWRVADDKNLQIEVRRKNGKKDRPSLAVDKMAKVAMRKAVTLARENQTEG